MFDFRRVGTLLLILAGIWVLYCLASTGDPLVAINVVTVVLGGLGGLFLLVGKFAKPS